MSDSINFTDTQKARYHPPGVVLSTIGIAHLIFRKTFQPRNWVGLLATTAAFAFFSAFATEEGGPSGYKDYVTFMYSLFLLKVLPVFTLVNSGGILRNEIKDGTLEYIWTRPISRVRTIGGLFVASVIAALIWGLSLALGVQIGASIRGIEGIWNGFDTLLLAIFATVFAFSALAMVVAAYSGKFVGFGIVYLGLVEMGISKIPTNINNIAITHHVQEIVSRSYTGVSGSPFGGFIGCLLIGIALFALAAWIFRGKSYSLGSEKED